MRIISKVFSTFVTVALLAWLMPLGAFINTSQEKTACGGGRAFHMCSAMSGKVSSEGTVKISFSNANSVGKAAKSSAAGGDDFVPAGGALRQEIRGHFKKIHGVLFCLQSFQDILVPPPKNHLLF